MLHHIHRCSPLFNTRCLIRRLSSVSPPPPSSPSPSISQAFPFQRPSTGRVTLRGYFPPTRRPPRPRSTTERPKHAYSRNLRRSVFHVNGPSRIIPELGSGRVPEPKGDPLIYTRAPWPAYREVFISYSKLNQQLDINGIKRLGDTMEGIDVNRDISAVVLRPALSVDGERDPSKRVCLQHFSVVDLKLNLKHRHSLPSVPNNHYTKTLFRELYSLCFRLHRVRVPTVVLLDGSCVSSGAGVLSGARIRCATPWSSVAFKQAHDGWFPDAGSSWLLSRLDGEMGMFLALTGWSLRGYDLVRCGYANHFIEDDEWQRAFGTRIGDTNLNAQFADDTIQQVFGQWNPHKQAPSEFTDSQLQLIDRVFALGSVDEIIQQLRSESDSKFCREVLQRMSAASPLSLVVAHQLITRAKSLSLEECLKLEYRLSQSFCSDAQACYNVLSAPQWSPATLAQVSQQHVHSLFESSTAADDTLTLEYDRYKERPWLV